MYKTTRVNELGEICQGLASTRDVHLDLRKPTRLWSELGKDPDIYASKPIMGLFGHVIGRETRDNQVALSGRNPSFTFHYFGARSEGDAPTTSEALYVANSNFEVLVERGGRNGKSRIIIRDRRASEARIRHYVSEGVLNPKFAFLEEVHKKMNMDSVDWSGNDPSNPANTGTLRELLDHILKS